MSSSYFTVASYDIDVWQDITVATNSGSSDGFSKVLTMRSASDNPTQMKADVYFTTSAPDPGSVGFVDGLGSTSLHVSAFVPLQEFDHWLDLLKDDRQTSFMFFYSNDAPDAGGADVAPVRLTTARDPQEIFGVEFSADRIRALPRDLQRIVADPS
jgi:hypothetical protein